MAKNVLRVGVDSAGGTITGVVSTQTFVGGQPIVCVTAAVTPHDTAAHLASPTMVQGSSKTTANGQPICGAGDLASCGHAGTSGSTLTTYGT